MKKILLLDNYDSFTYNLVHLLYEIGTCEVEVIRNDKIDLEKVAQFDKILLSPGPGIPSEAGLMPELVKRYASSKSILGVCLGHQCIGEVFGAKLLNMSKVVHGKATEAKVVDEQESLFKDLPKSFPIGRYHSWLVASDEFPETLVVSMQDNDGNIMALRHRDYDVKGLQFHPESVLTEVGHKILSNWIGA